MAEASKIEKTIGEVGCCESERIHWWTERWLECPAIYLSIHPSFYLSIHLPVYLPICLFNSFSIHLSTYPSSCLSTYLLSVYLPIHLSVFPSVCLALYLSMQPSIDQTACLCVYLSIYRSFYFFSFVLFFSFGICPFPCLSVYLSTCLSVYPSVLLSICPSSCPFNPFQYPSISPIHLSGSSSFRRLDISTVAQKPNSANRTGFELWCNF